MTRMTVRAQHARDHAIDGNLFVSVRRGKGGKRTSRIWDARGARRSTCGAAAGARALAWSIVWARARMRCTRTARTSFIDEQRTGPTAPSIVLSMVRLPAANKQALAGCEQRQTDRETTRTQHTRLSSRWW
eukprot:COSAG02_NODE_1059_length_14871_cov_5.877208_5_plen_131_part_00